MSKGKKKNKQNNRQQQQQKQVVVSDDTKLNIEIENEKAENLSQSTGITSNESLSGVDLANYNNAKQSGDLQKYLDYLQNIAKTYRAIEDKAEKLKEADDLNDKAKAVLKEAEDAKAEAEKSKKEYESLKAEWGDKDKEIQERENNVKVRERAIAENQYTNVITNLLDSIEKSQKNIAEHTQQAIDKIEEQRNQFVDFQKESADLQIQIHKDKAEIEKERAAIKRDKKVWEADKQIELENLQEEFDNEHGEKLKEQQDTIKRLTRKISKYIQDNKDMQEELDNIHATFEETDAQNMVKEYNALKAKYKELKEALSQAPSLFEVQDLNEKLSAKDEIIKDLQDQISQSGLLKLRSIAFKEDVYKLNVKELQEKNDISETRISAQQKQIEDLQSTISQLTENQNKLQNAFEYAKKCDADINIQTNSLKKKNPADLKSLVTYLQKKMASLQYPETPLYYSRETISSFMAGLYMSPISILQGISGTGKTSLPREIAKALTAGSEDYRGLSDDNTPNAPYRICEIQSGWRDNMDLMGNYNSFEGKYNETKFFRALYMANQPKYSNTLFFIILDEMNLSRPEHYFADFLSLLEQGEDERFVSVHAPIESLPKSIVGGMLKVPKNVRFIGTANHDETTLEFAPKTYDRSNLLEMPPNPPKDIPATNRSLAVGYDWIEQAFEQAYRDYSKYADRFKEFLNDEEVKMLLNMRNIGIGNRFGKQAERFISVYMAENEGSIADLAYASDFLITSRLLRTLKDNFLIKKQELVKFREDYKRFFSKAFKGNTPELALNMLSKEIDKKDNGDF